MRKLKISAVTNTAMKANQNFLLLVSSSSMCSLTEHCDFQEAEIFTIHGDGQPSSLQINVNSLHRQELCFPR
jgi:hypothetical protein